MQRSQTNQDSVIDALFISPHLDDAALSAAHTICAYLRQRKRVMVVTIFTRGSMETSPAIRTFLRQSRADTGNTLFRVRRAEDNKSLATLGVIMMKHLPFVDGLFRSDGKQLVYPTLQALFSGTIASRDSAIAQQIVQTIRSLQQDYTHTSTRVYTCLGVGNHVDHILVHNAVTNVFGKNTIYWEDVPYRSHPAKLFSRLAGIHRPLKRISVDAADLVGQKKRAVFCYRSQLPGLLRDGLGDIDYLHEGLYAY